MAEDKEILREIWDGKIPICFVLATDEIRAERPDPLYLLVSRQTYLPLLIERLQRHCDQFVHMTDKSSAKLWLEEDGQPLRWHYPVGVLFDLSNACCKLPWTLTVHFQNFPTEDILHLQSRDDVEAHFMSVVKEADMLKHRGQVINNMQKKDHKQLWSGLVQDKFDMFWIINRKLMEHSSEELFKHIPFRIYFDDRPFIQMLFKPLSDSGRLHSLEDLIRTLLPDVLLDRTGSGRRYEIIIQGIQPPLDTSVQWLSEHFSHPDNFLHIIIRNALNAV